MHKFEKKWIQIWRVNDINFTNSNSLKSVHVYEFEISFSKSWNLLNETLIFLTKFNSFFKKNCPWGFNLNKLGQIWPILPQWWQVVYCWESDILGGCGTLGLEILTLILLLSIDSKIHFLCTKTRRHRISHKTKTRFILRMHLVL